MLVAPVPWSNCIPTLARSQAAPLCLAKDGRLLSREANSSGLAHCLEFPDTGVGLRESLTLGPRLGLALDSRFQSPPPPPETPRLAQSSPWGGKQRVKDLPELMPVGVQRPPPPNGTIAKELLSPPKLPSSNKREAFNLARRLSNCLPVCPGALERKQVL